MTPNTPSLEPVSDAVLDAKRAAIEAYEPWRGVGDFRGVMAACEAYHAAMLGEIEDMLVAGQGDDEGMQILPVFEPDMSTVAKVEMCLALLERRRDVIEALRSSGSIPDGVGEPDWYAVHSVTGSHIGLWRDPTIARRVFEQEYPNGEIIPLYAAPVPPVPSSLGVKVKELEWEDVSSKVWDAPAIGSFYRVRTDKADSFSWCLMGGGDMHLAKSLPEAKAAAQADFNTRILSSLTTPEETVSREVVVDPKALSAARKRIERMMHEKGIHGRGRLSITGLGGKPQLTAKEVAEDVIRAYLTAALKSERPHP